jgi:hypothetical protein
MTIIFDGTAGITTPAEVANTSVTTPIVTSTGSLTLKSSGNTAVTVDTSQNVGIGTASPGAKADILQITDNNGFRIQCNNASFSSTALVITADRNTTNESFNIISFYNNTAGATRYRVTDAGSIYAGGSNQNNSTGAVYGSNTAKAWVRFNSGGTISGGFNVSSITKNNTGDYNINYTNSMPNNNYAVIGSAGYSLGQQTGQTVQPTSDNITQSLVRIQVTNDSAAKDANFIHVVIFAT